MRFYVRPGDCSYSFNIFNWIGSHRDYHISSKNCCVSKAWSPTHLPKDITGHLSYTWERYVRGSDVEVEAHLLSKLAQS